MNRLNRSIVFRVAMAVTLVAGAIVIVYEVFTCYPARDEAAMIRLYEADPLLAVAPHDGQLLEKEAKSYTCDNGHGGSPTSPVFVEVTRLYQTPVAYGATQLRQRFDQPAAAAGWHMTSYREDSNYPSVSYCKQVGGRAAHAFVSSTARTVYLPNAPARPGIEMIVRAAAKDGTTCGVNMGGR
ncbi:hypothetical protein ACQP2H_30635 [Micromonospora sp. CA-248260]|uniref:hypothetical protein n=1 Tax=Micromonospora sp. CA-248260 TaxID=3239962 RepID=UPI003D89F4C7